MKRQVTAVHWSMILNKAFRVALAMVLIRAVAIVVLPAAFYIVDFPDLTPLDLLVFQGLLVFLAAAYSAWRAACIVAENNLLHGFLIGLVAFPLAVVLSLVLTMYIDFALLWMAGIPLVACTLGGWLATDRVGFNRRLAIITLSVVLAGLLPYAYQWGLTRVFLTQRSVQTISPGTAAAAATTVSRLEQHSTLVYSSGTSVSFFSSLSHMPSGTQLLGPPIDNGIVDVDWSISTQGERQETWLAGIAFRTTGTPAKGYTLTVSSDGHWALSQQNPPFGSASIAVGEMNPVDPTFHMRVVIHGTTVWLFIDDELITIVDTVSNTGGGYVGITFGQPHRDYTAQFENIEIREILP